MLTAHLRALTETNFLVCTFCVNRSYTRTHRECACTELPAHIRALRDNILSVHVLKSPAVRSFTRTHRDLVMSVHVLGYPLIYAHSRFVEIEKQNKRGFFPRASFFFLFFGWLVPTFLFPAVFGSFLDGF